ncbi:MAG: hypothetical protein PHF86_00215 [Candidatus Nanoarchaeia archaeon]|nr:hypothetical protein [Candidatus Nanoarchaeia archaeon]
MNNLTNFNLSNYIYVKLNKEGLKLYNEYKSQLESLSPYEFSHNIINGYHEFQLYEFIIIFGGLNFINGSNFSYCNDDIKISLDENINR